MTKVITSLKIGRHIYEITGKDRFMDNGSCVQLLTQSNEKISWGHRPSPTLSKRAIKQISSMDRLIINDEGKTETFSLAPSANQQP